MALLDVRKELSFCRKTNLPIIGVVENMSGFVCPNCKCESQIFKAETGGAEQMCKDFDCKLLAKLPIDLELIKACDSGKSIYKEFPEKETSKALKSIVSEITSLAK